MSTIFFKKLHTAASNLRASHTAFFGFMHCLQYVSIRYIAISLMLNENCPVKLDLASLKKG